MLGTVVVNVEVTEDDGFAMERVVVVEDMRKLVQKLNICEVILLVWWRAVDTEKVDGLLRKRQGHLRQLKAGVVERKRSCMRDAKLFLRRTAMPPPRGGGGGKTGC